MSDPTLIAALANLLRYVEVNECSHEETHRGGTNWTICDGCGRKWADDTGGFKPYVEPKPITEARRVLAAQSHAAVPAPAEPLSDAHASEIGAFAIVLEDAVRHAGAVAHRAMGHFNGRQGHVEFVAAHRVIMALLDHPAIKRVGTLGIPPSLLR